MDEVATTSNCSDFVEDTGRLGGVNNSYTAYQCSPTFSATYTISPDYSPYLYGLGVRNVTVSLTSACANPQPLLVWDEMPAYIYQYLYLWQSWFPGVRIDGYSSHGALSTYSCIFIPMPLACSIQSQLSAWLALGHRRLIVTGEYGSAWDACSIFANGIMATVGASMRCSTGFEDSTLCFPVKSGLLVTTGLTGMCDDATANISGGTPVASGWSIYSKQTVTSVAMQSISGSEVLLTGDVDIFSPYCGPSNYCFLCNCISRFP